MHDFSHKSLKFLILVKRVNLIFLLLGSTTSFQLVHFEVSIYICNSQIKNLLHFRAFQQAINNTKSIYKIIQNICPEALGFGLTKEKKTVIAVATSVYFHRRISKKIKYWTKTYIILILSQSLEKSLFIFSLKRAYFKKITYPF